MSADKRAPRTLGAQRSLTDAVSEKVAGDAVRETLSLVLAGKANALPISDLEVVLAAQAKRNSSYTKVGEDDFQLLVDEVLNNAIRSVLVYGDLTGAFEDLELYSLSVAFQYNLSVEALTLSGVTVSDETVCLLCEALVRSRVSYIDLSNTPVEDEAGRSVAALSHINPFLRTVIMDDTLVSEDVLDEIDVACQFNQSNYEGNKNVVDLQVAMEADEITRYRQRLVQAIRSRHKKVRFCVPHLFGACHNGENCLFSHQLGTSGVDESNMNFSDRLVELFSTSANWEEKLPSRPAAGASWKTPDEEVRELRLNWKKARAPVTASAEANPPKTRSGGVPRWLADRKTLAAVGLLLGCVATAATVWRVRHH